MEVRACKSATRDRDGCVGLFERSAFPSLSVQRGTAGNPVQVLSECPNRWSCEPYVTPVIPVRPVICLTPYVHGQVVLVFGMVSAFRCMMHVEDEISEYRVA